MYLNVIMSFVPKVKGITEVQRKGKKAFADILANKNSDDPIFLADRNNIFAVVMSVKSYEKMKNRQSSLEKSENYAWLKAAEKSFDFWNDPSNDVYDQLADT